jgi:hypothetical protein
MLLEETPQQNILTGGVDETTDTSHHILSRFGLFNETLKHGEGSAFFILSGSRGIQSYAKITSVSMIYRPASAEILNEKSGACWSAGTLV